MCSQAESSPNLLEQTTDRQLLFRARPTEVALRAIIMSYDQDVDMNDRYDQWALDSFCYSCSRDESQEIA